MAGAEAALLETLGAVRGRGAGATPEQEDTILRAVYELETAGGLPNPIDLEEIEGNWKLLYTSKSKFDPKNPLGSRTDGSTPGLEGLFKAIFGDKAGKTMATPALPSSSPIQRTITSNEAFSVSQEIDLRGPAPHVDQVVRFGDVGELRLVASATTPDPARKRINFAFEEGYFEFKSLPLPRLPYPVPFKLLGEEAKGWLETTYLSERVRISRGNKGTTFILGR